MRVQRYAEADKPLWDDFVRRSKNGTFLFERDYMDYHRDRFTDHSLLVYDDADHLVALLPANCDDQMLISHGGLTYGGFISDERMKLPLMFQVFEAALSFCREHGFTEIWYKAIPHIFHRVPAEEDLYALLVCDAGIILRSAVTVIDSRQRPAFQERRRRGVLKARKLGLSVRRADDHLAAYWGVLEATLQERHQANPVHTLAEIDLLQRRFPQNIQLHACFDGDALIAGVLIFETERVARAQYIAASPRGRELGALDLLFDHLINVTFADKPYFDFGTSHDPTTHAVNGGLIDQKEGFGGRTVVQDVYEINLERWNPAEIRQALL